MNANKISVIVPVYNGELYLKECLDSLINQTYENLEIIVVDNKSEDGTARICDEYALKDNRVKVIHRVEHGWICDGRNDGLAIASGEWITFVDADDWIDLNHYEMIMNRMLGENVDVFCQGGCICEYPENRINKYTGAGDFCFKEKSQILDLTSHIFVPIYKNNTAPINMSAPWDKFYKRSYLIDNSINFDTEVFFADDSFFNAQVFTKASAIAGTSHIGYHYRQNSVSVTHKFRPDWPNKIYSYLEHLEIYLDESQNMQALSGAFQFTTLRCFLNMLRGYYFNKDCSLSNKEMYHEVCEWTEKAIYKKAIYGNPSSCLSTKLRVVKLLLKYKQIIVMKKIMKMEKLR